MTTRLCGSKKCKDKVGNCSVTGTDGFPVQCVGPWAEDKYSILERYLNASCKARKMFADRGNAVYIDLFAGPGKCIIRKEKREIESGCSRAINRNEAPFNEFFLFDIVESNSDALKQRFKSRTFIENGDSNILVNSLVKTLKQKEVSISRYRYHFAFIDPFGAEALKFSTIAALAEFNRMDMLIHFPVGSIKRNIKAWTNKTQTLLDDFLGTDVWRHILKKDPTANVYQVLINTFKDQLIKVGYPEKGLRLASSDNSIYPGLPTVQVKNTKDVNLYALILASKNELAQKLWNSIIRIDPSGQRSLPFK